MPDSSSKVHHQEDSDVVAKPYDMGLMINPVLDPAGVRLISKTTESYLF